jgi:hypothetical protein
VADRVVGPAGRLLAQVRDLERGHAVAAVRGADEREQRAPCEIASVWPAANIVPGAGKFAAVRWISAIMRSLARPLPLLAIEVSVPNRFASRVSKAFGKVLLNELVKAPPNKALK